MKRLLPAAILAVVSTLAGTSGGDAERSVVVAAVQYNGFGIVRSDPSCQEGDDRCALHALVREAAKKGAKLVVLPEAAIEQLNPDPDPFVGELPEQSVERESFDALVFYARLAMENHVYLVVNAETRGGRRSAQLHYSAVIVISPAGRVVAKHHKFELFDGEIGTFEAGRDVTVYDSPFGRIGLLACADVYGDPRLHDRMKRELGVQIVAFPTLWTVPRATRWQAAFAGDWGVYLIAANSASLPAQGGGIYDPSGHAVAVDETGEPAVVVATIPIGGP